VVGGRQHGGLVAVDGVVFEEVLHLGKKAAATAAAVNLALVCVGSARRNHRTAVFKPASPGSSKQRQRQ
jgi:hypothetical protein